MYKPRNAKQHPAKSRNEHRDTKVVVKRKKS